MVWGGTNPGVLGTFSKFWPRSALDSTLLAICNWRIRVDSSRNQCFSTSPSVRNWRRLKLLNLKQDHDFEVVSLSLQNSTTNKKTRLKSLLRVFSCSDCGLILIPLGPSFHFEMAFLVKLSSIQSESVAASGCSVDFLWRFGRLYD